MKLFISLIFLAITCTSFGQYQGIGDVKYSVLQPDSFMKYNPGWVEMDGGASHTSDSLFRRSILHQHFKVEHLPDGRGVFIRGMNRGRNPAEGDTDGDTRPVGGFQWDMFKKHNHGMKNWHGSGGQEHDELSMASHLTKNALAAMEGGAETRPRNITLYVYIKIN